jgi:hypothetical protein
MIESEAAMDFELSKEQQEIKDRAAAFVEEACRPLEQSWGNDDYAVRLLKQPPVVPALASHKSYMTKPMT